MLFNDNEWKKNRVEKKEKIDGEDQEEPTDNYDEENYEMRRTNEENDLLENSNRDFLESKIYLNLFKYHGPPCMPLSVIDVGL